MPCAPIKWGTHQCYDRWQAQHRCPWLAPPATDMQSTAAQGHGGMPRRFEWQTRSLAVNFPGAAPLGCCYPWQTCLWTTADRSGPWQHAAWQHHNCHSGSHYCISATPSAADTIELPGDITMPINLQLQGALEWLQWASPTASAPVSQCSTLRREPPSAALGALPSSGETEDPLRPQGRLSHPCPNSKPHTDVSAHGHNRWHPLLQPTMPKTPRSWACACPPRLYQLDC